MLQLKCWRPVGFFHTKLGKTFFFAELALCMRGFHVESIWNSTCIEHSEMNELKKREAVTSAAPPVLHPDHVTQEVMSLQRPHTAGIVLPLPTHSISFTNGTRASQTDKQKPGRSLPSRLVSHDKHSAGPRRFHPALLWTLRVFNRVGTKLTLFCVWTSLWGSTTTGLPHPQARRQRKENGCLQGGDHWF